MALNPAITAFSEEESNSLVTKEGGDLLFWLYITIEETKSNWSSSQPLTNKERAIHMHTSTELLSFSQIVVSDYSLKTSSLYPLKLKFLLYHPICFKEFVSEHKSHIKHMPSCNFWKQSMGILCFA